MDIIIGLPIDTVRRFTM